MFGQVPIGGDLVQAIVHRHRVGVQVRQLDRVIVVVDTPTLVYDLCVVGTIYVLGRICVVATICVVGTICVLGTRCVVDVWQGQ